MPMQTRQPLLTDDSRFREESLRFHRQRVISARLLSLQIGFLRIAGIPVSQESGERTGWKAFPALILATSATSGCSSQFWNSRPKTRAGANVRCTPLACWSYKYVSLSRLTQAKCTNSRNARGARVPPGWSGRSCARFLPERPDLEFLQLPSIGGVAAGVTQVAKAAGVGFPNSA